MSDASKAGGRNKGGTRTFAGRYAYKKPLGRGAGGSVYLAEDLHVDRREVALKVLSADAVETVQGKMLRREFEILSKLDHPNLVRVYDYGTLPDGGVYLAEEYIDGFSLQDARALLEPAALIEPTLQVLQGLAYLHGMQMIHRDVKPANVMLLWLDDASARPMVKLVDFGLSSMDPKRDTLRGGTRSYMAPEIIRGNKGEYRSDLYSLGVTLYYALCGVLPWGPRSKEDPPPTEEDFRPPDPHRLNEEVPLELSRFTMALLRQLPDVDYVDAGEALQALAADAGKLEARSVGQMANSLDVAAAPVVRGYFERGILPRRVEEDDLLLEWISMSRQATMGQMYLVRGEQGVGKSRLLHDVQASAKLDGHLVVSHRCDRLDGPYALLIEMLERLFELARSHDVHAVDEYRAALQVRRILTGLGVVTPGENVRPMVEQSWMRTAVEEVVEQLDPKKVVFFIDDIDQADEPSLEILEEWFRPSRCPPRPDIVATSCEGEVYERVSGHQGVHVLPIEGVGVGDVESFFRDQLGLSELSDSWIESVADAAEGRPAYIEELCRYLIDAGILWRESATSWRARVDDVDAAGVPETLRESLRRRITEVGAAGRECLELLALMDRPLSWKSARVLLERGGSSTPDAEETLQTVQWRHLITTLLTQGGRYVQVVHRQLAEAVADMISPQWRRALHRRIGQQVAEDWKNGVGNALEAASHLQEGGEDQKAAPYFEIAADFAQCHGDPKEAADHYDAALAGIGTDAAEAAVRLKAAEVALRCYEPDKCRDGLEQAAQLADAAGHEWLRYRVYTAAARAALATGDLTDCRRWIERVHSRLSRLGQGVEVSVLEAVLNLHRGQFDTAAQLLEQCPSEPTPQLSRRLVTPLLVRARLQTLQGRQKKALESYGRARALVQSGDDSQLKGRLLAWYGADLRRMDKPVHARETLGEALELLADTNAPHEVIEVLFQLAWTLAELEESDPARRRANEAFCLAGKLDHRVYEQKIAVLLGGLVLRKNRGGEEALDQVDRVVESFDRGDSFVVDRAELLMALGDLMITLQLRQRGPKLLQRGRQLAFNIGARGLLPPLE